MADYDQIKNLIEERKEELEKIKKKASVDLVIDEIDLDKSVLETPRIFSYYNNLLADNTLTLKDLYSYKESVKLERWKYYSGKQTDKYYATHGIVHEKILKTDVDKYLSADPKLELVNSLVSTQKAIVDYLERCLKEIGTRNFHVKSAIDWRKFTSGA